MDEGDGTQAAEQARPALIHAIARERRGRGAAGHDICRKKIIATSATFIFRPYYFF